jgi:hypothetical protein
VLGCSPPPLLLCDLVAGSSDTLSRAAEPELTVVAATSAD